MKPSSQALQIPYRMFIGAIGRSKPSDSSDEEALVRQVDLALVQAQKKLRDQAPANLRTNIAPSPLCSGRLGFERLVAKRIMERHQSAQQHFVLPMLQQECLDELASPEDKQAFKDWLSAATVVQSIGAEPLADLFSTDQIAAARQEAWLNAGKYIIDNCDVILLQKITPGDPEQARIDSLTSYAKEKRCPCFLLGEVDGEDFVPAEWEQDWDFSRQLFEQMDKYNQRLNEVKPDHLSEGKYFKEWLRDIPKAALPDQCSTWIENNLIAHFAFADNRSTKFRDRFQNVGKWAFRLALLAAGTVGFGIAFFHAAAWVFLLESLLLIAILLAISWADRTRSRARWTEYRYLAERLRTAYYLAVTGVDQYPEYFSRKRGMGSGGKAGSEANLRGWSSLVFNEVITSMPPRAETKNDAARDLANFIKIRWIDDQYSFHHKKAHTTTELDERHHKLGESAFYAALAVALLHGLPWGLSLTGLPGPYEWLHHQTILNNTLTLLALVLPAAGATIGAVRTFMEYKRLSRQSTGMRNRLQKMRDFDIAHLSGAKQLVTPKSLENTVRQLERLMLTDVQDWRQLITAVDLHKAV